MKKITHSLIFAISLPVLFACSEPTSTGPSTDTTTTTEQQNLDLSLPDETSVDQKIQLTNEQPLMPELFDQKKAPSKYQLGGQVLLNEEERPGVDALDGAEIRITIKN